MAIRVGWVSVAADRVEVSGFGCDWSGRVRLARCPLDGTGVGGSGPLSVSCTLDGHAVEFHDASHAGGLAPSMGVAGGGRPDWLQLNGDIFGHLTPGTE